MSYRDRLMGGVCFAPDGEGAGGAGAAAPAIPDFAALTAQVPETLRSHEAIKGAKDVGGLFQGLVTLATPKPVPAAGSKEAREAFLSNVPEKIRGEAAFKDIHDVGALADSYYNAHKMVGLDKGQILRLPTGPDDKEGHAALRAATGVPESADKYVLPDLKKALPEGVPVREHAVKSFATKAYELGVGQKQIDGLMGWYAEDVKAQFTEAQAANAASLAEQTTKFKTDLGAAYEPTLQLAQDTLTYYAKQAGVGPEVIKELDRDGLGQRPGFTKMLAVMGKQLQEDGLIGKGGGAGGGGLAPAEALQQVNAKHADTEFMKAYRTKGHPGHDGAVKEMAALYEQAYPTAPAQG